VGQDITFMEHVGMRPVVVHGGGPRITALMKERRKEPVWVDGLRVTDPETLEIVMEALEQTNNDIVDAILSSGGRAIGLSYRERLPLRAERLTSESGKDLGAVGRVTGVAMGSIVRECLANRIPVVLPLAAGPNGAMYNVNADAAAGAVAAAIGALKLVLLSDTHGIRISEDEDDYAASLTEAEARDLMRKGVIAGGMIPKTEACIRALAGGVQKTHIIDGRLRHSLLLEIYTDEGIGTQIVP
jgi:acetylglutamate kinase